MPAQRAPAKKAALKRDITDKRATPAKAAEKSAIPELKPAEAAAPEKQADKAATPGKKATAGKRATAKKATLKSTVPANGVATTQAAPPSDATPTSPAMPPSEAATEQAPEQGSASQPAKEQEVEKKEVEEQKVEEQKVETEKVETQEVETQGAIPESTARLITAQPTILPPAVEPAPETIWEGRTGAELSRRTDESVVIGGGRVTGPLWARLADRPGHAPELLALAAVETIGPRARDWVRRTRETYPTATPHGLARLATRRYVRLAGTGGAIAATTGAYAPVVELASVAWTQSALVLHLAAAFGLDPTDPERAADLLVLTRVQPNHDSARAALTAATGEGGSGLLRVHPMEGVWRLVTPFAAQAGGWLVRRLAARLLPGAAVLTTLIGDAAAVERLAARAVAHYHPAGWADAD